MGGWWGFGGKAAQSCTCRWVPDELVLVRVAKCVVECRDEGVYGGFVSLCHGWLQGLKISGKLIRGAA